MRLQKIVAMIAAAAVFVVAPSVIPMKRAQAPVHVASAAPCGVITWVPVDSALAVIPTRTGLLKLGVDDMRLFFENDLRFLSQFSALSGGVR